MRRKPRYGKKFAVLELNRELVDACVDWIQRGKPLYRWRNKHKITQDNWRYLMQKHPSYRKEINKAIKERNQNWKSGKLPPETHREYERVMASINSRWPTKYDPELIKKGIKYVEEGWIAAGDACPTWQGVLNAMGISPSTAKRWRAHSKEIDEQFQQVEDLQKMMAEYVIINRSLDKTYSADFAKFYLVNKHGYQNRQHIEAETQNKSVSLVGVVDSELHDLLNATLSLGAEGEGKKMEQDTENPVLVLAGDTIEPADSPHIVGASDAADSVRMPPDEATENDDDHPPLPFGTPPRTHTKTPSPSPAKNFENGFNHSPETLQGEDFLIDLPPSESPSPSHSPTIDPGGGFLSEGLPENFSEKFLENFDKDK